MGENLDSHGLKGETCLELALCGMTPCPHLHLELSAKPARVRRLRTLCAGRDAGW